MSWPGRSSGGYSTANGGRTYPAPSSGPSSSGGGGGARVIAPRQGAAPTSSSSRGSGQHGGHGGGGGDSAPPSLNVGGCSNPTVAGIIQGSFVSNGVNHGKPLYKKEAAAGAVSVLIYFWDERDGPSFSGWWFGPKVGGDQVWAYNSQKASQAPPTSGWRVPWDGPIDETLRISLGGGAGRGSHPGDAHGVRGMPGGGAAVAPRSRADEEDRRRRDEEHKRREDERRRAEEHKRREDERRRQEDERRRQEDDRRRRQEEEDRRRREDEERRRKDEERRRREEEDRRRREEEHRRREAEAKRRREEEEIRQREQGAALIVRKVIQRVRIATPETYDSLRGELEECLKEKADAMGSQASKVSEEAEQTLRQAQRRIDELVEQRAAEERRRQEEEKRRREEAERVEQLMKDAAERAKEGEDAIEEVEKACKAIAEGKDVAPEATVEAAEAAVKVMEASRSVLDKGLAWFSHKHKELRDNSASRSIVMEYTEMTDRLESGRRNLDKLADKAEAARERAARKKAALAKEQERKARFEKHDLDKDGKLSREEVIAFAKLEHDFEVPAAVLSKIMGVLESVTYERFHPLHQKVAIAKLEAQARIRRAEEEERKRVLAEQRQAVQRILDEADALVVSAEDGISKGEAEAKPLSREYEMPADEMKELAASAQALISKASEDLKTVLEKLAKAEADCAANIELRGFEKKDVPRLYHRQERAQDRVERVTGTLKRALERAERQARAEIDQKYTESVVAIHKHLAAEGKTSEELFADVAGDSGTVTCEKFAVFVKGVPDLKLAENQAQRLFEHVSEEGTELSKERFLAVIQLYYKCVKSTVCSEELGIKSKTVRRLDVGEILEALGGPAKEEGAGVQRVRCQALQDSAIGWVTICGNQGTPFLVQHGNFFSVGAKKLAAPVKTEGQSAPAAAAAEEEKATDAVPPTTEDDAAGAAEESADEAVGDGDEAPPATTAGESGGGEASKEAADGATKACDDKDTASAE